MNENVKYIDLGINGIIQLNSKITRVYKSERTDRSNYKYPYLIRFERSDLIIDQFYAFETEEERDTKYTEIKELLEEL